MKYKEKAPICCKISMELKTSEILHNQTFLLFQCKKCGRYGKELEDKDQTLCDDEMSKEMKPKTLNNIRKANEFDRNKFSVREGYKELIFRKDVKEEAIKWVKACEHYGKTPLNCPACRRTMEMNNITEEDLKESVWRNDEDYSNPTSTGI